jgi:large subunit ribosomal protein L18
MARSTRELRIRRHKRVRKNVAGTTARPRVAIFRSHKQISAQIIDDTRGVTLAAVSTLEAELNSISGANIAGATAAGTLLAERATAAGITTVVFDRGGFAYHGRVAAFADALRAGGLEF